jgi:L-seryl-tRNA(Ser) seleniumtransferase
MSSSPVFEARAMKPAPDAPSAIRLPSVDRVLKCSLARDLVIRFGQRAVSDGVRLVLARQREAMLAGHGLSDPTPESVAGSAGDWLEQRDQPSQRRVFNLTGTVLHTNLGRAVLADTAIEAVVAAMRHPTTLEFSLKEGERGERDDHVRSLVAELTGAEDACLVNNNAAAVLLVLATHAKGRETIVSRGELIEIGGSFRLPEIMRRANTRLVEVGATNRTHPADFEQAIGPKTGLLLRAHTSNYSIEGFTAEVPATLLARIAHRHGIPLYDDLGSGTLVDLTRYGLKRERTVQDALRDGADLVSFSGDKLLGGPQAGFIVGRKELVQACARNHLKRTIRIDKLRLAALEATLKLYRDPDRLAETLPTLRFFARSQPEMRAQAHRLLAAWTAFVPAGWTTGIAECASQIGSGALPLDTLPSAALFAAPPGTRKGKALDGLSLALRRLPIPVIGRIHDNRLLLDLRCLEDESAFLGQLSMRSERAPA